MSDEDTWFILALACLAPCTHLGRDWVHGPCMLHEQLDHRDFKSPAHHPPRLVAIHEAAHILHQVHRGIIHSFCKLSRVLCLQVMAKAEETTTCARSSLNPDIPEDPITASEVNLIAIYSTFTWPQWR